MTHFIEILNKFTMSYLDPIGIWIGLILAIPVFSTWLMLLKERRQKKKTWEQAKKSRGNNPAVLIVDILPGKNISANIKQYLNSNNDLKEIADKRIITLSWNKPLKPEDMSDFALELRKKISEIYNTGADRIHLFFGGPYSAATIVGSELANNMPTILYQYDIVEGEYKSFGPLKLVI